jgi:RND family efflux transporter MFP subunit
MHRRSTRVPVPFSTRGPRAVLLLLLLVGLAGLGLVACRGATPDPAAKGRAPLPAVGAPAVAVRLTPVARGPVARPVRGTGVLRLKSEVDLSFKVGGVVVSVLAEEGAAVKKGQLLARLDPTEVDAVLRQARDGQAKADRDLERVRHLHASGSLPVVDLQNAETGASLARASVDAAGFNAQRAAIYAPDDGRIDRRMIEPGEVVAPGRAAFHFSGRSKGAIVRIGLTDRDVLRVRDGDIARVVLDARPDLELAAKVTQIATVASPGAGTFDVEVRLDSMPEGLLSGLTAKIEIRHDETVAAVVPIGALVDGRGNDASVFIIDGDRAKKVSVKVAFLRDDRAALASGLEHATSVVGAGAAQLDDGMRVRVTP